MTARSYPCPTCGENQPLKMSKKEKPYLVCLKCGVQLFIRGKIGISKISENMAKIGEFNNRAISATYKLIKMNSEINLLKSRILHFKNKAGKSKLSPLEKRLFSRFQRRLKYISAEAEDFLQDV